MKYSKRIMCAIFFVSVFGLEHSICPENCICSQDQTQADNIVNCSSTYLNELPQKIPENITELYLDGSYLVSLKNDAFVKNKKLKILYFNDSYIHTIEKGTFYGLKELEILRLDWNALTELRGDEFKGLVGLKELYLQFNEIETISYSTFIDLKLLKVLHLDHNRIIDLNFWNLLIVSNLKEVTLGNNPLSCACEYTKKLKKWMIESNIVYDLEEVKCMYNPEDAVILYIDLPFADYLEHGFYINKNDSACTNTTKIDSNVNGNLIREVQNN